MPANKHAPRLTTHDGPPLMGRQDAGGLSVTTASVLRSDVRTGALDPLAITQQQGTQLRGEACARCPRRDNLSPGGFAYMTSGPDGTGRLGYPVRVCPDHRWSTW